MYIFRFPSENIYFTDYTDQKLIFLPFHKHRFKNHFAFPTFLHSLRAYLFSTYPEEGFKLNRTLKILKDLEIQSLESKMITNLEKPNFPYDPEVWEIR